MTAWTGRERERLTRPTAVVSVRKCQVGPAGFQDYLGERFDRDSGQWTELYGRKAELTLGLDLYAPEETEGAAMEAALFRLARALVRGRAGGREHPGVFLRGDGARQQGAAAAAERAGGVRGLSHRGRGACGGIFGN